MPAQIALGLEYDGSAFNGWQRQSHRPSVQSELEAALSQVANHPVRTVGAGRTDAGVHATGQVASFQTTNARPMRAWCEGVNALTSAGVKVRWARGVDADFNARFSAIARRYIYLY
ncbi:MAG: tRNA pseudouridine synthase A, partial [Gammaproteobacteria bacterium]|nr:tRNA pseudouridine synthase A [Gammaproteobacteria bacterium]